MNNFTGKIIRSSWSYDTA